MVNKDGGGGGLMAMERIEWIWDKFWRWSTYEDAEEGVLWDDEGILVESLVDSGPFYEKEKEQCSGFDLLSLRWLRCQADTSSRKLDVQTQCSERSLRRVGKFGTCMCVCTYFIYVVFKVCEIIL